MLFIIRQVHLIQALQKLTMTRGNRRLHQSGSQPWLCWSAQPVCHLDLIPQNSNTYILFKHVCINAALYNVHSHLRQREKKMHYSFNLQLNTLCSSSQFWCWILSQQKIAGICKYVFILKSQNNDRVCAQESQHQCSGFPSTVSSHMKFNRSTQTSKGVF